MKLFIICLMLLVSSPTMSKEVVHQVGMASWYGHKFHGRKTASGEKFNKHAYTAAHRNLKFGTSVRVTNLLNNKSVIVTINDRGPFVRGRVIDLSRAAASAVDLKGTGKVSLTVVK